METVDNSVNSRRFELPYPVSKNKWQRMHWASRAAIKKQWEQIVWAECNSKPRIPRGLESVVVHLEVVCRKAGAWPDPQNVTGQPHECIADGLQQAGVLVNDGPRKSTGDVWPYREGALFMRRCGPSESPKTVVTIKWKEPT